MNAEDFLANLPNNMKRNAVLSFEASDSPKVMQLQIKALTDIVYSLCQEVETMRELLIKNEKLTANEYDQARRERMLKDHTSVGPNPWVLHSYYRYMLDEDDFLREILKLDPEQIQEFRQSAQSAERLT
ncbi:MAG: hypothetical protein KIT34_00580 [Cyanobacteria bacterium TGS_CYA1]|nr:hypothetical protein [Cyanobacteria bacterium TGS_CYA1]